MTEVIVERPVEARVSQPEMPNPAPPDPPGPSERLRTVRTLIVAIVVMWVVLVAAWAINRGFTQAAFADQREDIRQTRLRLAGVEELSSVFAEVNRVVEPSVVKIDALRIGGRAGPDGRTYPEANSGSGVVVDVDPETNLGYVVTNNHVVANASRIAVTLADGRSIDAQVLGTDAETDLAVLRIEAENLIAAEWGDSDTLRKGDWVLAFGSPFGFVGSMTAGIVSALNRTQNDGIATPLGPDALQNFIQVDTAINPGNSGGPLVNVRGEVIGINTAIFTRTGEFSGIGFAIPSNQAKRVYDDIRTNGRFIRGWLGIGVASVNRDPARAQQLGFEGNDGVIVTQIYQATPAAESGLRRNDIILQVDDEVIRDAETLRNQTAFARTGQTVSVEVFRDGQTLDIPVVIDAMPDDLLSLTLQPSFDPRRLGMQFAQTNEVGLLITEVEPDSPAAKAGIREGDFLLAVGRQRVTQVADAMALLSQADPQVGIELLIGSGQRIYRVVVRE